MSAATRRRRASAGAVVALVALLGTGLALAAVAASTGEAVLAWCAAGAGFGAVVAAAALPCLRGTGGRRALDRLRVATAGHGLLLAAALVARQGQALVVIAPCVVLSVMMLQAAGAPRADRP